MAEESGSWWDTVTDVASKVPSALDIAAHAGSKVAGQAAEAIPAIGAIPAVISGMGDSDKASDARNDAMNHPDDKARVAMDTDKDAFYKGREDYDMAGAIPLVGTALDIGEVAGGVYGAVSGDGYKAGSDAFKNMTEDGINAITGQSKITGGASHTQVGTAGWGASGEVQRRYEQEAAQQGQAP